MAASYYGMVFSNLLRRASARCSLARPVVSLVSGIALSGATAPPGLVAALQEERPLTLTGDSRVTELVLRLYIAGGSAISRRAEQNLIHLQKLIKPLGWEAEVVDVLAQPERAEHARILATPTLSYEHPVRPRRIVGDLSDTKKILDFLGIELKRDIA